MSNMLLKTRSRFALHPRMLAADTAIVTAEMLGWLVEEPGIEAHIPVFDEFRRTDGTFPATYLSCDPDAGAYRCHGDRVLKPC